MASFRAPLGEVIAPETGMGELAEVLLAGNAVHFCREAGLETTPAWTRDESRYVDRRVAEASAR